MYINKTLSIQNLEHFNFEETKKSVNQFFKRLEKLEWEWAKVNVQNGLTADYDFSKQIQKQSYTPIGKDLFSLSAKENTEELFKRYMCSYYWAKSILSDKEQQYIEEYFVKRKYEDELVEMLGFVSSESSEFRKLKRSAIYKIADFLGLVVENS